MKARKTQTFVVGLERLETFFRNTLDTLLLLLFGSNMKLEHSAAHLPHTRTGVLVRGEYLPTMGDNRTKIVKMLLLSTALTFFALLTLKQLGVTNITQGRPAETTDSTTVDSHDCRFVEMLSDGAAQRLLASAELETFEFYKSP